jgi:hypothetical protein
MSGSEDGNINLCSEKTKELHIIQHSVTFGYSFLDVMQMSLLLKVFLLHVVSLQEFGHMPISLNQHFDRFILFSSKLLTQIEAIFESLYRTHLAQSLFSD